MNQKDRCATGRAAYLADHEAVAGTTDLLAQLRAAERFAVARWGSSALRLFVDSGRADNYPERGPALERLLEEIRAGRVHSVVVRRHAVMASSLAAARRAVNALTSSGATVYVADKAGRRRAAASSLDVS